MRPRWNCPDLPPEQRLGHPLRVLGAVMDTWDECPAYYLRTAGMDLPAEHLLENGTHVGRRVGEWAFEVKSGSRNIDTLSPKAREGIHLHLSEESARERQLSEMRKDRRGKHS